MKKHLIYITLILFAGLVIASCHRRPLEDEFFETATIPVRIDWSASGVDEDEINRASVLLYSTGGQRYEYRLEGDVTQTDIEVPVGTYNVLVYNETHESDDWSSFDCSDTHIWNGFHIAARIEPTKGFYSRSDSNPLICNPEPIAAWSMTGFTVSKEMVRQTIYGSTEANSEITAGVTQELTVIVPRPRYEWVHITARVGYLSSAIQATGLLHGCSDGVYMASGNRLSSTGIHPFIMGGRTYYANNEDGTITSSFRIFGLNPDEQGRYRIKLDFVLTDGYLHEPAFEFDVTDIIRTESDGILTHHYLELGFGAGTPTDPSDPNDPQDPTNPIILPRMDIKADVTVDEWGDHIIIPVQ